MSFLGQEFKESEMPEGGTFEPLPPGTYNAQITEADLKDTKSGTGQYLALRLDVTGPKYQGRVLFSNLNIRNQSAKAEEIARRQLGELMRAIGLATLSDSDQLIGKDVAVLVKTEKSEEYGDKSVVVQFKSIGGSAMPTDAKPAETKPRNGSKPPWAK